MVCPRRRVRKLAITEPASVRFGTAVGPQMHRAMPDLFEHFTALTAFVTAGGVGFHVVIRLRVWVWRNSDHWRWPRAHFLILQHNPRRICSFVPFTMLERWRKPVRLLVCLQQRCGDEVRVAAVTQEDIAFIRRWNSLKIGD
jgi:hypothetical protein